MNYYERRAVRHRRHAIRMATDHIAELVPEIIVGLFLLELVFYGLPLIGIVISGIIG